MLIVAQRLKNTPATILDDVEYTPAPSDEVYTANTCIAGCVFPRRNKHGVREGATLLKESSRQSFDSGRTILTTYTTGNSVLAPTVATRDSIFSPTIVMNRRNSTCTTGYSEADRVWGDSARRYIEQDQDRPIQDLPYQGHRLDSAPWISLNETLAAEARAGTVRDRVWAPSTNRMRTSAPARIEDITDTPVKAFNPQPLRQVETVTQPPKPSSPREGSLDSWLGPGELSCEETSRSNRYRVALENPILDGRGRFRRMFGKRAGIRNTMTAYWRSMCRKAHLRK